jgi:photosystem II stability/assembly factor-like uncharacterized protein
VPAWRLGAVLFVSRDSGLALTAPLVECHVPLGNGGGTDVYSQPQPVRLAMTSDGGRHWVTSGAELPVIPQSGVSGQVAAVDGMRIWVVSATGKLLVTRDAGATWAAQPAPGPVVAAGSAGGWMWVLSCPPAAADGSCRPGVARMELRTGRWTGVHRFAPASVPVPWLYVLSGSAAVTVLRSPHPELASTVDGGVHWTVRAVPAGPGDMCGSGDGYPLFTAAGLADWWLLCTGGAAAGSSTKALMHSANGGLTWTAAAALTSLSPPYLAGALPGQDAQAIAAGPAGVLWLATPNMLTESTDGGVTWQRSLFNPKGSIGQFDVLSGTLAWLLAPNAGLWRTTDGATWQPVGVTSS